VNTRKVDRLWRYIISTL